MCIVVWSVWWNLQSCLSFPTGGASPRDATVTRTVYVTLSVALYASMSVLAGLGILLACGFLTFNIVLRKVKYVNVQSLFCWCVKSIFLLLFSKKKYWGENVGKKVEQIVRLVMPWWYMFWCCPDCKIIGLGDVSSKFIYYLVFEHNECVPMSSYCRIWWRLKPI